MAEEKDVNIEQPVTDPDANIEQVVTGQGEQTDPTNQQPAEEAAASQDKTVPYDRFKEVNDAKKAAEEQAAYAQRQLELMQMQANQTQQVQQTAPQSTMEQAMAEMGMTAEDLYGENIVKVNNRTRELDAAQTQQNQARFTNQQFIATHPDVNQVVGSVNPATGQIMTVSPELYQILAKKQHLTAACTSVQAAYDIVMEQRELDELRKGQAVTKEHQVRTGVDVATQPMGSSAAGGGGTGSQGNQQLLSRAQSEQIRRDIADGKYSS